MNYLSIYKCYEFREPSNNFIGEIEDTPENIAAFVASSDSFSNYALLDETNAVKIFTMGQFLDLVFDVDYLENELKPILIPMQLGEMEIPKVKYKTL